MLCFFNNKIKFKNEKKKNSFKVIFGGQLFLLEKWVKYMNRRFIEEEILEIKIYMKRCKKQRNVNINNDEI